MAIDAGELRKLEGKTISDICQAGYTDANDNHCAHFVSHVMGLQKGFLCTNMKTPKDAAVKGASIRVHELFAACPEVGKWSDLPATLQSGLVFITDSGNVNLKTKQMANVPKKHVGIFIGSSIWHYSNTKDKVVTQSPDEFSKHYNGAGITMYYGKFPI
jgi:hypothetical protein